VTDPTPPTRTAMEAAQHLLPVAGHGTPMLPPGKYVVEMIVPPGYELVKEEDKNILLGDAYEAPVVTQFAGFGNIFIMPDQARSPPPTTPTIPQPDDGSGVTASPRGDTGSIETFWPCVGAERIVPTTLASSRDRNRSPRLPERRGLSVIAREVTLADQMSVLAKFYVFTSTHIASHFTGIISDDFTSEFDPFSPASGRSFHRPTCRCRLRLGGKRNLPHLFRRVRTLQRSDLLDLVVNPPDRADTYPR